MADLLCSPLPWSVAPSIRSHFFHCRMPPGYTLKHYSLSQNGPAFGADAEISMTPATGAYRVGTTDREFGGGKSSKAASIYPRTFTTE